MKKIRVIILLLFLMSCSSKQAVSSTTSPNVPTSSPAPTETTVPSTPTLTPTSTSVPTIISAITWTPFPTYSPTDGTRILRTWIKGSLDCLLPCWGGIIPGKTSWQETKQLLEPLSGFAKLSIVENANCDFGQCNGMSWSLSPETEAEGNFYMKSPGDMVHLIVIDIRNAGTNQTVSTSGIKIKNVLEFYGLPDLLLFDADLTSAHNKFLEITLVYPKRHFIIQFSKKVTIAGATADSCGQYRRIKLIVLDNQEQLMSLDAISQAVETKDLDVTKRHKSAQEAIGMTNSAFYEYFSQRREPCLSTPLNIWTP